MGMFNQARKSAFTTEIREIFKVAQQQWVSDSLYGTGEKTYARCKSGCDNSLDLSGREEIEYYIRIDKGGKVVEYYASDGTYQYEYTGGDLKIEDINDVEVIATLGDDSGINVSATANGINCNGGEYLKKGEYICTACPAGSYCPGGNYKPSKTVDQGKGVCVVSSYSSASSSACTACEAGKTTVGSGKTMCTQSCDNKTGVTTWNTPIWNEDNTVSNVCSIASCQTATNGTVILEDNYCKATGTIYSGYLYYTSYGSFVFKKILHNTDISGAPVGGYYFDRSELNSGASKFVYLKLVVTKNIVSKRYACFTIRDSMNISGATNGDYCLEASDDGSTYQSNVAVLKSAFGNSHPNCKTTTTEYKCEYKANNKTNMDAYSFVAKKTGEVYAEYDTPPEEAQGFPYCEVSTSRGASCYNKGCLDGETEVEVYDKKKKKRRRKKLKDVTKDDLILCWDFKTGKFVFIEPIWIKKVETMDHYYHLEFNDGSHLNILGDHKLFDADRNKFVNAGADNELHIGSHVFNSKGEIVELVSYERINEKKDAYNVITNYHMNLFANGILTSCVLSNIYQIADMKYVDDSCERLTLEDLDGIDEEFIKGLRLNEVPSNFRGDKETTIKYIKDYIEMLISKKK